MLGYMVRKENLENATLSLNLSKVREVEKLSRRQILEQITASDKRSYGESYLLIQNGYGLTSNPSRTLALSLILFISI